MLKLVEWFDPRRPTGVLVLLLPAIAVWTGSYWLADVLLPVIGAWTHLVVPAVLVALLAVALRAVGTRDT